MAIQQHEISILSYFDTAHPVIEHHRLGPVNCHDLKRLLISEAVSCQKCTVFAEVFEVLVGHVSLDARSDTCTQKLLKQVRRLRIIVVLNDHHRADDRDDTGPAQEID